MPSLLEVGFGLFDWSGFKVGFGLFLSFLKESIINTGLFHYPTYIDFCLSYFLPLCNFSKSNEKQAYKQTVSWYIPAVVHIALETLSGPTQSWTLQPHRSRAEKQIICLHSLMCYIIKSSSFTPPINTQELESIIGSRGIHIRNRCCAGAGELFICLRDRGKSLLFDFA